MTFFAFDISLLIEHLLDSFVFCYCDKQFYIDEKQTICTATFVYTVLRLAPSTQLQSILYRLHVAHDSCIEIILFFVN